MSASNRAAALTKLHKQLKKLYTPVTPPKDRTVLEHLIYACVHENSAAEPADEAFARLQEIYYDWNEVRVTTVVELSEELNCLKKPAEAAHRVRNTLNAVFETHYAWDLEFLKKENLGKALQKLDNYAAVSPYALSYLAQHGLGGHSIPLDDGAMMVFYALGYIAEKELKSYKVTGLERAIPKNKGIEFASLIHQIGADLYNTPFGTDIRNKITKLDPTAKDRLPKRARKPKPEPEPQPEPEPKKATKKSAEKKSVKETSTKKAAKKTDSKKSAEKKTADKKVTKKKAPAKKKVAAKKAPAKKAVKKKAPAKKVPAKKAAKKVTKKTTKKAAKKTSKKLAKKKPR